MHKVLQNVVDKAKQITVRDAMLAYSTVVSTIALAVVLTSPVNSTASAPTMEPTTIISEEETTTTSEVESSTPSIEENETPVVEVPSESETAKELYSEKDIELLALVMLAEAEGECEEGQRLVVDVILNRVDSDRHPNTIHDVVYQKGQFTSMWNGRTDRVTITDEARQLVREELESRTDYDVIYFRMYDYHRWGTPLFKVGCHYFSAY